MNITEENWKNQKLRNHYLYLHKYLNNYLFNKKFGSYFSTKVTMDFLNKNPKSDILEIGIGAGNFYRLLKINKIKNNYTGADISENYVNLANKVFNCDKFVVTDKQNKVNLKNSYNIVYSRNVALHQKKPFSFLDNLIDKTENILIFELRSRDVGETEYDENKSYQEVDNTLVPYIVINIDELKKFLINHQKCNNSIITINRDYKILGGKNLRFLPKELSNKNTKTANTTVIIEMKKNKSITKNNNLVKLIETFESNKKIKKDIKHYLMVILNNLRIYYNFLVKKQFP